MIARPSHKAKTRPVLEASRPTRAELEILRVLWSRGAITVREVHDMLHGDRGAGYTTVLKLMQIMHAKGYIERDESRRAHVYSALVSRENTQKRLVSEMVQRLFNGSSSQLVLHALGNQPHASKSELHEIRKLLDRIEREQKGGNT